MLPIPILAALVGAYLLGSIPFGLVLTKLAGIENLRSIGSGNIGATNVLRTGRKDLAAATLFLDTFKATAAVLIAGRFGTQPALAAALGAFLGHLFPVWLKFRGGKGVATFLGCLIGLAWPMALVFGVVWLAVAFLSRYSSAAAIAAAVVTPLCLFVLGRTEVGGLFAVLAVLLILMHRQNISRLAAGTEGKIGRSS
jgi:glycerol-3-phosphate acyltransferase PlsY